MRKSFRHFSWAIFQKYLFKHSLGVAALFLGFSFVIRQILSETLPQDGVGSLYSKIFQDTLMWSFLGLLILVIVFTAWIGWGFAISIQRLVWKANRLAAADYKQSEDADEAAEVVRDDPWDLSDLEIAIERLRKKIEGKDNQILQENSEIETLMSGVSEAVIAVDLSLRPLFYNSQFAVQFEGPWIHSKNATLTEILRQPELLDAARSTIAKDENRKIEVELRSQSHDCARLYRVAIAPLRAQKGNLYGALIIFHDMTEMKHAERLKTDFVANVSHELRTPLAAIKGYAQTLSEDFQQKKYDQFDKYTEIIQRNADRLMNLVSDLLDLSALESGIEMKQSMLSTREITERTLEQVEMRRKQKTQLIVSHFDAEEVYGDLQRVEQVLINLVENATKYVQEGGKITIWWESATDGVSLRVVDNGPGIPTDKLDRLFERFYRLDEARSRQTGGTGLGLAIVKHIMQRHRGWTKARNTSLGTEFVCFFPTKESSQL